MSESGISPAETVDIPESSPSSVPGKKVVVVQDWFKGCRKCWDAVTRLCASNSVVAIFFTMLPSFYASGLLIYIGTGLAKTLVASLPANYNSAATIDYFWPVVEAALSFTGVVAGITYFFGLLGSLAIFLKWPGIIAISGWTLEVMGHFLFVFFFILLFSLGKIFSYFSLPDSVYYAVLQIVIGSIMPACIVWAFCSSIMYRCHGRLTGELT